MRPMSIAALEKPIAEITTASGQKVLSYVVGATYADSFGYEWKAYPRTYSDLTHGVGISLPRLEQLLGFPADFLQGMNVLELGSGAGRFTELLTRYARQVVTVDYSDAILVNSALGQENLLALRCDLMKVPPGIRKQISRDTGSS